MEVAFWRDAGEGVFEWAFSALAFVLFFVFSRSNNIGRAFIAQTGSPVPLLDSIFNAPLGFKILDFDDDFSMLLERFEGSFEIQKKNPFQRSKI